ncbi:hypothetical protein INS49_004225 [Diaporthe citri]|uniref:uncharacterized protein n=1 Tax=Diaporthe citri TaxID=83186 RepID=UPI001C81B2A5|nr:uncharacterized protein INS49_004225 [Diaporthe citri]KAG6355144.1 hypothetical protein INS49_004225 [Diaporthe citri]
MANDQNGFDGLSDRVAAQREGLHMDRLHDSTHSGRDNNQDGRHGTTQMVDDTAPGSAQDYVTVFLREDLTTPAELNRTLDGNQDARRDELSDDTNAESIYQERNEGGGNGGEHVEPALMDGGDAEVLLATSTTADGTPNMDTTTMPGVDMGTEPIVASKGGSPGALSFISNENGGQPTSEPHSDGGDDAQSNTGSHETTSQPGSSVCTHADVNTLSWTWSLILYASSGVRTKCNACGEEQTKAELSSLLKESEEGGAKLNWEHISNLRWVPGAGWSWSF